MKRVLMGVCIVWVLSSCNSKHIECGVILDKCRQEAVLPLEYFYYFTISGVDLKSGDTITNSIPVYDFQYYKYKVGEFYP